MKPSDDAREKPRVGQVPAETPGRPADGRGTGVGIPPGSLPGAHYVDDGAAGPPVAGRHLGIVPDPHSAAPQMFRTRAAVISGWIDVVVGLALVAGAGVSVSGERHSQQVAIGVALGVLGLVVGATGVDRVRARLEVQATRLVWRWGFARHELDLADITEAALVEPGAANPGGALGGLLGGGIVAVAGWWMIGVVGSIFRAGPTLGSRTLIVLRKYGPAVRIDPIGTFSQTPGSSPAFTAQQAVQTAIDRFHSSPSNAR